MEAPPENIAIFREKVESYHKLPDESFQKFADHLYGKKYSKGEVMLREGEICRNFWFLISGCIRSFSLEHGEEINTGFYFDNEIVSDFHSVRTEKPSLYFFVAMEDCETLYFKKAEIVPLFRHDHDLMHFAFRFYQDNFFKEKLHSNTFKLMNPEERYQYLLEHQPHYLQRIPLTHLASYLGTSRETLSRIRKKIS